MAKREVLRAKICTGPDRNRKENLQYEKRVNPGRQKDGADDRELRKALPLDKERELLRSPRAKKYAILRIYKKAEFLKYVNFRL